MCSRPAHCQQVARPRDIPTGGSRGLGGRVGRRGGVEPADVHEVDAAHQLVIDHEFSAGGGVAARFGPGLGVAEQMGGGASQLRKVRHDAGADLVEIVDARHAHVAHVAEKRALVFRHVSAGRVAVQHEFLVVQMHHVIHAMRPAPILHGLVEIVAEHSAPDIEIIGFGPRRFR